MKVRIDLDLCESNGICVAICPEVFKLDGDDVIHVLDPDPQAWLHTEVIAAAAGCPRAAVILTDP
jgi:ferredoxin